MIGKQINSKTSKTPGHKSARAVVKLQKINRTLQSYNNKHEGAFNSISSVSYNTVQRIQKKISLNDQIFHRRKQNHLNTQYNKRLNALKKITKQNKKIYQRINSQKSLYSQDSMRKSTTSIHSASRSTSRVSNQSKNKEKQSKRTILRPEKQDIVLTIQPEKVSNMKQQNLNQFKSMFLREKKLQKSTLVNKRQNRSFSLREDEKSKNQKMGNMLHKIAQQMYQKPEKKKILPNNRRILC